MWCEMQHFQAIVLWKQSLQSLGIRTNGNNKYGIFTVFGGKRNRRRRNRGRVADHLNVGMNKLKLLTFILSILNLCAPTLICCAKKIDYVRLTSKIDIYIIRFSAHFENGFIATCMIACTRDIMITSVINVSINVHAKCRSESRHKNCS